jgi:hypothetical protein
MRQLKQGAPELFVCGVEPVSALIEQGIQQGASSAIQSPLFGPLEKRFHFRMRASTLYANLQFFTMRKIRLLSSRKCSGWPAERFLYAMAIGLIRVRGWHACEVGSLQNSIVGPVHIFSHARQGYMITEGDGLAYSYSLYDSFELVAQWADRIILVPSDAKGNGNSWFHPLLNCAGVLVCAIKEQSF